MHSKSLLRKKEYSFGGIKLFTDNVILAWRHIFTDGGKQAVLGSINSGPMKQTSPAAFHRHWNRVAEGDVIFM